MSLRRKSVATLENMDRVHARIAEMKRSAGVGR